MKIWIVFSLLVASSLASGQGRPYPKAQAESAVGQTAPDFTLKDQDGKDFRLSDQRGHWVLLYFYRGYW
jgi:peroxiredoxin Q/BCP